MHRLGDYSVCYLRLLVGRWGDGGNAARPALRFQTQTSVMRFRKLPRCVTFTKVQSLDGVGASRGVHSSIYSAEHL
jgi:hypothetical protein